jgi:hypothetical protein
VVRAKELRQTWVGRGEEVSILDPRPFEVRGGLLVTNPFWIAQRLNQQNKYSSSWQQPQQPLPKWLENIASYMAEVKK